MFIVSPANGYLELVCLFFLGFPIFDLEPLGRVPPKLAELTTSSLAPNGADKFTMELLLALPPKPMLPPDRDIIEVLDAIIMS